LTDFLNVLVNQRFLYQAQDALALSEQRVSTNLVALFKALGGGWEVPDNAEARIPRNRGTKHEIRNNTEIGS
jgi:outer membrane protein TolC